MAATGYDHSVLVDLLTSPETCFLTYFTKYLKYSLSTWDDLVKEYKYCLSPHQTVLSKTEESDMVMVGVGGIKRDNDRVCKDRTNLLKTSGLSVKHCNAKYVENIGKAEVEENMKLYMNAVHNQCNSEAENRSNGSTYGLHDNQTLRTGSNHDNKELLNTDKTRGDNVLTESVDLCNINGFSNEKLKSCVGEHRDSDIEILKVKDQTSHNSVFKASESSYGEVESKIDAQVLEDHKACMCVTDKSSTFIQCSGKRSACNVKDSNISPDLKKKCIMPQKKQNFFMEKESVNIETGNEELSPKCEQYSCLESVEFVEEIQSQETYRLLAGTDKESVLIKEGENGDMVSIQCFSQHADRENDTLRAAEYLQTNGMLRKNPNLCSTITNLNVRKRSESRQKHNQSFLTNVSNKGNVGNTNEEHMLDSNNSPVQTKEDYAAISNDLDSVEVLEEEKSKETQKLEAGQCNKESLLLTEGEELESMTFENVVCTGKTEICKTDEKRVIELENFKTQTDMATEIDKELENIEFQECYSMKDITEFKLVNYEIDDSDSLSDSGDLDSSTEVEDIHNAIDSEPSKNSEIQIDGIDYDITVSERISSSPGLVDYVMSDEDEIMILNELKSDINKSSFLERSSEYKTSFENNSGNKSLDTLMGVFIRVRMKTEKLKSANILQYNPQSLLRLLHALEDKYESL